MVPSRSHSGSCEKNALRFPRDPARYALATWPVVNGPFPVSGPDAAPFDFNSTLSPLSYNSTRLHPPFSLSIPQFYRLFHTPTRSVSCTRLQL
jgi:hypothetical protein